MCKFLLLWTLFLVAFSLHAQENPQEQIQEIKDDTNPTKPVFLSFREEYYKLDTDVSTNLVIIRSDKVILDRTAKLRPKGVILRWDLPIATTTIASDSKTGLSDLYTQAVFFPRLGRFTLAAGSGIVFPTATDSLLGRGKWQLAPIAVPLWFFTRAKGFFLVKVQDFFSFAGNGSRADVHYLLTTPTLMWRVTRKSWILLDSEAKTNWERDNITSYRSGVQIGRMLNPNLGFWIKPEIPWGKHKEGDWTLKFTFILAK